MVTYNRLEFTRQSIESIVATAAHPYSLTVVDNASTDGTVDFLRELEARGTIQTLILNTTNAGVAFAANQGWAADGKAYYMKIDNDIVFTKLGWLARIVEVADNVPRLGAVAYNFETASYPVKVVDGYRVRRKKGNVGGCCVLIPGGVHRRVGYWCEDYRPYSEEDFDMYVRLRRLGLRSYYMEDENVGLHLPDGKASPLLAGRGTSVFDEGDPAYRAEKDRWRAQYSGPRGLRAVNESLYRARLRSVYIDHGVPYRPGKLARLFVAARFGRVGNWDRGLGS